MDELAKLRNKIDDVDEKIVGLLAERFRLVGEISKVKVKLKIPAGIESGKLIRIRGKGMFKPNGQRGDQYVKVEIITPKKVSKKAKELLEKLKEEGL